MDNSNSQIITCPVCKADKYLNPNLKLSYSPCFHKMCEDCITRLFTMGPAPCPICKVMLRKSNFTVPMFDDIYVEKEVQTRKKLGKIFNKRLEDFKGDLRRFNDYLENVEEIMFKLINNVDVDETNRMIEQYRAENRSIIEANSIKQMTEEQRLSYKLEKEKQEKQLRREHYRQILQADSKAKAEAKDEIIQTIAQSSRPLDMKQLISEARTKASHVDAYLQAQPVLNEEDYMDLEDSADWAIQFDIYDDPEYCVVQDNYNDPWTKELKTDAVRAGGYIPKFTYNKAVSSAFSGLFTGANPSE